MNLEQQRVILDAIESTKTEGDLLDLLRSLRQQDPEKFIKVLYNAFKAAAFNDEQKAFLKRWDMTPVELCLFLLELVRNGHEDEMRKLFEDKPEILALVDGVPLSDRRELQPTSDLYIRLGVAMLRMENRRSALEMKLYVNRIVDDIYTKPAKPFTNQQVNHGLRWYSAMREKNSREKGLTDQRSRSRFNVTHKQWLAYKGKNLAQLNMEDFEKFCRKVQSHYRKGYRGEKMFDTPKVEHS